ncbi:hypothetical protein Ddc_22184 [Ditylenchus destructor]|nr:hypothetical protein Ddc_22184 [Ditylenchus destructor]
MRRLPEKQAKFENETQMEPNAQKSRSDNRITNIAALDNDTIVEAFKYLNYCRLAKTSLVSKRFSNLIRTHRHKLARIYVDSIGMTEYNSDRSDIKIFNKTLSPEEYNNWVIHNCYSKQIPLETQIAGKQSTQNKHSKPSYTIQKVFDARTELNHENWPVFQHYFRVLTDPFVYIRCLRLPVENDGFHLLAGEFNPDCGRIQCQLLMVILEDNMQNRLNWIKGHVQCYQIFINNPDGSNCDPEELLDLFMTGANCASEIKVNNYNIAKVIFEFVQKFMDLKSGDEDKVVGFIECQCYRNVNMKAFKRDYADFVVEGNINEISRLSNPVFEFVNNDIGKKLRLTISVGYFTTELIFTLKVASL